MLQSNNNKISIIIADDNAANLNGMKALIEDYLDSRYRESKNKQEFEVIAVADGTQALLEIGTRRQHGQLKRTILITDDQMPSLTGIDLISHLRHSKTSDERVLPICFMTGGDNVPEDGMTVQLYKPLNFAVLFEKLDNFLDIIDHSITLNSAIPNADEKKLRQKIEASQLKVSKDAASGNANAKGAIVDKKYYDSLNEGGYQSISRLNQEQYIENDGDYLKSLKADEKARREKTWGDKHNDRQAAQSGQDHTKQIIP